MTAGPRDALTTAQEVPSATGMLVGCGNEVIRRMTNLLHARIPYLRAMSLSQPGRAAESLAEMKRLAAALRSGDPEAAHAARVDHIDRMAAVALLQQHNISG